MVDDLIVYRNSDSDLFLVPNAANTASVVNVLKSLAPAGIEVKNLHEEYAVIALQGPKSHAVMSALVVNPELDYMAFAHVEIAGCKVILCRTGYTGELGFELLPKWSDANKVWDALVTAIRPFDGLVCGLGARDTLRTEMGYPLHGHELTLGISPVEAGATWAIGWKKGSFRGSDVLTTQKEKGTKRILKAIAATDRGIPRAGMQVKDSRGKVIGEVTSGTFSPTLKKGIGLALIDPTIEIGSNVVLDVRGRDSICEVVTLPFVPSHVR